MPRRQAQSLNFTTALLEICVAQLLYNMFRKYLFLINTVCTVPQLLPTNYYLIYVLLFNRKIESHLM